MIYIAAFSKVSESQFTDLFNNNQDKNKYKALYEDIKLPMRSTAKSAGYDFYCPYDITIAPYIPVLIPTGIRCQIDEDWVLMLFPRSSMGFKYGMRLLNSVGIIDADYYNSDNEGHIMAKITVDKELTLHKGDRFMQGVFLHYSVTTDDEATGQRIGGIGSTGI